MNKGQIVSLIHCKCGISIKIYPNWEQITCPCCKEEINLAFEPNIQNENDNCEMCKHFLYLGNSHDNYYCSHIEKCISDLKICKYYNK